METSMITFINIVLTLVIVVLVVLFIQAIRIAHAWYEDESTASFWVIVYRMLLSDLIDRKPGLLKRYYRLFTGDILRTTLRVASELNNVSDEQWTSIDDAFEQFVLVNTKIGKPLFLEDAVRNSPSMDEFEERIRLDIEWLEEVARNPDNMYIRDDIREYKIYRFSVDHHMEMSHVVKTLYEYVSNLDMKRIHDEYFK